MRTPKTIDIEQLFDKLFTAAQHNNPNPLGIALIDEFVLETPSIISQYGEDIVKKLKSKIEQYLYDHDMCEICGHELEFNHYSEYHPEVDAYEPMCEAYCPNCGG